MPDHVVRHPLFVSFVVRLSAATAADRPSAHALTGGDVLGDSDLLILAGGVGHARAAVGTPGAEVELQPAVVAVAGVDGPVATRLTGCNGIPVVAAVRIRGTGTDDHRGHSNCPSNGNQSKRCADVLHVVPLAERAPNIARA